jgi:hypothetical protein
LCDLIDFSDTLKRHQKLHRGDTDKAPKRSLKTIHRGRSDRGETSVSDQSTESSADQSPIQEVTEPQFCYETLETWEYSPLGPTFALDAYCFPENEEKESWFEENYLPIEGSASASDLTVNPENLWDIL